MTDVLDFYPSSIIGRTPEFKPSQHPDLIEMHNPTHCKLCALPLNEGDEAVHQKKAIKGGFTNVAEMSASNSAFVCNWCCSLMKKPYISQVQGYTSNKDETPNLFGMIYYGGENPQSQRVTVDNALSFLLDPQANNRPFVFIRRVPHTYAQSGNRHTAWMASVNFNQDRYQIQIAYESLTVDTNHLNDVIDLLSQMTKSVWPIYPASQTNIVRTFHSLEEKERRIMEELTQYNRDLVSIASYALDAQNKKEKNITKIKKQEV